MRAALLLSLSLSILALNFASAKSAAPTEETSSGAAVIREMSEARQNPAHYAQYLELLRSRFQGKLMIQPGHPMLLSKEGVNAVDEAIHFLHSISPQSPLALSPGMCRAAADHVADQSAGRMGHGGSDSSSPGDRLNRYGLWSTLWGENISYGKRSAREIVLALIVDDGLRGRKHRANIFNATFNYAGAATGTHATFRTVCSIEFAGGYVERGLSMNKLIAQNP